MKVFSFLVTSVNGLACSENIVRTAESQGFLSHMYNCTRARTTGPQECLASFILANSIDNPHPIWDAACRKEYETLMNYAYTVDPFPLTCTESSLELGELPADGECLKDWIGDYLPSFYSETRFYPFRMCTGAQVRTMGASAFHDIIDMELNGGPTWLGFDGACEYCYLYPFANSLSMSISQDTIDACLAGPTAECLATWDLVFAMDIFTQCSGYDIRTQGDMCLENAMTNVESLIPNPYFAIAQCAYNAETPFCATIESYMEAVETASGSPDCFACYTELNEALVFLADAPDVGCGVDLFSDECLSYHTDVLFAFQLCSGFTLNTDPLSTFPSTATTVAPITDSTTWTAVSTEAALTSTKSCPIVAMATLFAFIIL